MGALVDFTVKELPELLLVGKELRHSMEAQEKGDNPLPGFWDECFSSCTGTPERVWVKSG